MVALLNKFTKQPTGPLHRIQWVHFTHNSINKFWGYIRFSVNKHLHCIFPSFRFHYIIFRAFPLDLKLSFSEMVFHIMSYWDTSSGSRGSHLHSIIQKIVKRPRFHNNSLYKTLIELIKIQVAPAENYVCLI